MNIVLENRDMVLTLTSSCIPVSLMLRSTGRECLICDPEIRLFTVTQDRPYNNEIKLAHMNKRTEYRADRVRREGDLLIVGFEVIPYEAVVRVNEADWGISFRLEGFRVLPEHYGTLKIDTPQAAEFGLVRLNVARMSRFGEWLNVMWDEDAAVCVLAASPAERIDSRRCEAGRILTADAVRGIRMEGAEAALIACKKDVFGDRLDAFERAYGLPHGVESRRGEKINASVYWTNDITPLNADEHIARAKQAGLGMMLIYYKAIFVTGNGYDTCGDYDYRPEYPEGRESLRKMMETIKAAGITPGFHFLQTFVGIRSRYVTPVADARIRKKRSFLLARPVGPEDTEIVVDQDPAGSPMQEDCRVLQLGGEMVHYTGYTAEQPYRFTGCTRGWYGTERTAHDAWTCVGIADVCEFGATSLYMDQETSLPDEVSRKLADAYNAGFEFIYFDGSEGTNPPFEYHVPNAQYRVLRMLDREPILTEGAAKAHFSWHFLSGGNAFDVFPPEVFKQKIAEFPAAEAPRMQSDFTRLNFGWWRFWAPDHPEAGSTGTQADQWEYGTALAAAWDCPATIQADLAVFRDHPRTDDILETIRRWEDVRRIGWLTPDRKAELRDPGREHTLLIDASGSYRLVRWVHARTAAHGDPRLRAFVFVYGGESMAAYWHTRGEGELLLAPPQEGLTVREEPDGEPLPVFAPGSRVCFPLGRKRYIASACTAEELIRVLEGAEVVDGAGS